MNLPPSLALAQALLAVALGLIALPAILGSGDPSAIPIWLAAAALIGAWLLALGPSLAGSIGARDRPERRAVGRALVAVGEAVVVPLLLRRPIVAMVGGAGSFETIYAAFSVGLVLATLIFLYRQARPLIEQAALDALDAIITTPSAGWQLAGQPTAAAMTTAGGPGQRSLERPGAEATVAAGTWSSGATVLAPTQAPGPSGPADEATLVATGPRSEATLAEPGAETEDDTIARSEITRLAGPEEHA